MTETMFPNAERAIRKFNALEEFFEPKTSLKNKEEASCFEVFSEALRTKFLRVK